MANVRLYGQNRADAWERWHAHLSGAEASLVCVISSSALPPATADSLDKAFAALGYGQRPCTFLALQAGISMAPKDLFSAVEALDPVLVVIADDGAAKPCGEAWRQAVPQNARFKLFGRHACSFSDLSAWMSDEKGKHQVWALLRSLPQHKA